MNYLELQPAKAKSKSASKLYGRADLIAEEKMNGWRFLMHLGRDLPRVVMTGRRISKVTGKFSEKGECAPCLWPYAWKSFNYTVLDGEVIPPPGATFWDMASIMNADPETAAKTIARIGEPTYHVFDCLFHDDQDLRERSMLERKSITDSIVRELCHPNIHLLPTVELSRDNFDIVVRRGGEGLIAKEIDAPYGEGWYKIKKVYTLDVIVTGFTAAKFGKTGQYDGQIGAAKVSVYSSKGELLEVGQVSGMTNEIRLDMTNNKESWIGRVIEVEAQEWAQNRLAHPRWNRERPDANPLDCTYAKMMQELRAQEPEEEAQTPKQGSLF